MVQKKESTDRSKFGLRTRGKYLVANMPEQSGKFVADELVAELRRCRSTATLADIAGDYGESVANFRRYREGKPMPLAKGRRFARRLKDLQLAAVNRLERLSQSHPRGTEAIEFLRIARRAYFEGHEGLAAVLDEREDILLTERIAVKLERMRLDAETLAQETERISSRFDSLRLALPSLEEAIRVGIYYTH